MRMTDSAAQPIVELSAIQNNSFGDNVVHGGERNHEVTGILHIYNDLRSTVRHDVAHSPDGLVTVMHENFKILLNGFTVHSHLRFHWLPGVVSTEAPDMRASR
jgi:hypothetical protein